MNNGTVGWDEANQSVRTRRHEQDVGELLNSLIRSGELLGTEDWSLGYVPGNPSDWDGTPPTTAREALDRCARLAQALFGGNIGP